jgi:putative transposase
MARLSRVVIPDIPHHVTQRGNRRQALFTEPGDDALYRDLLAERCRSNGVSCWAYCLRTNAAHSPWNAQPRSPHSDAHDGRWAVARGRRSASAFHRLRCAGARNRTFVAGAVRLGGDGEAHCLNAVRYLAFNPAPARLSLWNLSSCAALHPSQREWAIKTGTKMGQAGDDDAGDASHRGLAWHAATKREIITLRQQDSIRRPLLLAVPVPPSKPHGSPPQSA